MTFRTFIRLILSDLYRYDGKTSVSAFVRRFLLSPGYNFSVKMRLCKFVKVHTLLWPLFPIAYFTYRRTMHRFGICIPYNTVIGEGLYIGHFGGIVINSEAVLGRNINLSHGVTIGKAGRGSSTGCPTIADGCYLGPGSVVSGRISLGNNVAVGANAFVNTNAPDNAVIVGVPARVVSFRGANDFVKNKWTVKENV